MKKSFFPLMTIVALAIGMAFCSSCEKPVPDDSGQPLPDTPEWQEQPGTDPGSQSETPVAGEYVLPLIETTDIHGHMLETDVDGTVHYRLAYIADKADDLRGHADQRRKDRLLLLDGGDLYQGASVSNLLSGWPIYVAADLMGYDAVAVGNHEFDWGIENTVDSDATMPDYEWSGRSCENKIPVLCANMYQNGSRVSFTDDYAILEKTATGPDGASVSVKIGVVGFAVDYSGSIMSSKFTGRGFSIDDDYSIANGIANELETSLGCDATILLIHGQAKNAAKALGAGSPIDLVLGGHSHGTLNGVTGAGIPYLQGGCYGTHYASATLKFTVDADGVLSFSGVSDMATPSVIPSRDTHSRSGQNADDLSEDILEVSDASLAATAAQQNDVIGYINVDATTSYIPGSGQRAATMSNWMCDITRSIGEADVAFVNSGGIRVSFPLEGRPRRDITVANVYEMFPFDNEIYVYRLTYRELLDVFVYSLTSGGSSLFSRMTGLDCHFSSGTVRKLVKDGVTIYSGGSWKGDWASQSVILAVSSYLATTERTDYYTGLPNPLIEWNSTDRLISDYMVDNENAVRILRAESAASGGLLRIDTSPHYIED